ncbi:unnamed protein product [Adineta ricciae]|uniref:Uncharacterized protein n=1 Tax=Adineta ricciae TaxID=249248 RepID=A0A814GSR9_ADIRI|nr:unnamed protein product [Adineta ricciae]CAF1075605.1 unnamed protein product [Adineta ricciae]
MLISTTIGRSTGNTLEELHRFFEDDPDDYLLESEAESRLKALYSCLVNSTSRTMLQIGLSGLLTYVKASQRSAIIDELLLSKDYISEIITIAADHFTTAPLLSATCLYECMLAYPKKFSTFLINKFRPVLPRIIYKKMSGPSEISCKCIAHLSVLGIPSSSKQAKSWKNEYDRYLKIASLLIDQLYSGINDPLYPEVTDLEAALIAEVGDVISSSDYAAIFVNCCHILRYLFFVQLECSVSVPCERTFKLISKVISITSQQFNILHRKQHLPTLLSSCIQLCDTLVTFNPSSFMFNIRSIFSLIISLLDLVRPQAEYLTLSTSIYQLLTNLFALFQRQVRMDVDVLQNLIRWILNDTTIRTRTRIPVAYLSKPDPKLSRAAINCTQQLLNVYSDHMPKDQYIHIQNHFIHTILACQTTNTVINKPYDDELCRVGLYDILECLLINERADCTTIIGISKDVIDNAALLDSSVKVKMTVRKLKLIWQQVHDSSSQLYQPWSLLNIDKPRRTTSNQNVHSTMTTNDFHNVFAPSSMPMITNVQSALPVVAAASSSITMLNTEPSPLNNSQSLSKPAVYKPPTETTPNIFLQAPAATTTPVIPVASTSHDIGYKAPSANFDIPVAAGNKEEFHPADERQAKRMKVNEIHAVEIDNDEDDDGAEHIFNGESEEELENEHMDDYDEELGEESEEIDESDELDDDANIDEDEGSNVNSDEDDENYFHSNGIKKPNQHLGVHQSNVDLLGMDGAPSDTYLQAMNDNSHKKFRRQNHLDHQCSSHHPSSTDFSHINNNVIPNPMYHSGPLNGDCKGTNKTPLDNGQTSSTSAANASQNAGDDDDDDDDIVLVSDDDSEDKKPETKTNNLPSLQPIPYMSDLPITSYVETVTIKSTTTTTIIKNDPLCGKDLYDDIDRETMDSLRDAVNLVSDDYMVSTDEQN